MKKLSNIVLIGTISLGFIACSSEDDSVARSTSSSSAFIQQNIVEPCVQAKQYSAIVCNCKGEKYAEAGVYDAQSYQEALQNPAVRENANACALIEGITPDENTNQNDNTNEGTTDENSTGTTDGGTTAGASLIERLIRSTCAEEGVSQSRCDCTLEKLQNAGVTDIESYQNALQDPEVIATLTTCQSDNGTAPTEIINAPTEIPAEDVTDPTDENEYAELVRAQCKAGNTGVQMSDCDCVADKMIEYNITSEAERESNMEYNLASTGCITPR